MSSIVISSVTGGVVGGFVGCVTSPIIASASLLTNISSNVLKNKNEHVNPPNKVSRDWVCFTTAVGAGSGLAVSVVYHVASYSLGLLSEYLSN